MQNNFLNQTLEPPYRQQHSDSKFLEHSGLKRNNKSELRSHFNEIN
jgi:hypothetical protein